MSSASRADPLAWEQRRVVGHSLNGLNQLTKPQAQRVTTEAWQ